jgi:serine/threonine protein phosphatase PrpC
LAGIKGLWILGIFDGHGVNGHMVSDFAKKSIPYFLSGLINNGNNDNRNLISANGKKIKNKASKPFLPPLVNSS